MLLIPTQNIVSKTKIFAVLLKVYILSLFLLKAKNVHITAIGIGKGINVDVLHEIAGERGNVVMVSDFDKLLDSFDKIKEAACCK